MVFQGLPQAEARAAFQPLIDFVERQPGRLRGPDPFIVAACRRKFWDGGFITQVRARGGQIDARPDATPADFWWSGDGDQVGVFWHAYTSAWMPTSLLEPANQARLVDAWFAASRHWTVAFHFNKGLAGAPPEAIAASRDTPTQSRCRWTPSRSPSSPTAARRSSPAGRSPTFDARARADRVHASMKALQACAPDAGSYVNETDYFQDDWQRAFWGPNYPRLARIKRRYDPDGLFTVHHGVGSEAWSADGFLRLP